jgi:hypothetical protein
MSEDRPPYCEWDEGTEYSGLRTVYECKNCHRKETVYGDRQPPQKHCRKPVQVSTNV